MAMKGEAGSMAPRFELRVDILIHLYQFVNVGMIAQGYVA
jgi:hypothetical protein